MRHNFVAQLVQLLKCRLFWTSSWRRIGPILLTNAGCRLHSFQCISLVCWACFWDVMISLGFRKLWCIRRAAIPQTVAVTFLWCKFGFEKCTGALSQSNHWARCRRLLYKIHFLLPVTVWSRNGSLLLHKIREEDTLEQCFFGFVVSVLRHPLNEVFHLYNLLQKLNDRRMAGIEFFGSFLCGCERISFGKLVSWLLSAFDERPLRPSSRLSSPLQNLNHHCSVRSLAVPGPDALLKLLVVSDASQPILNSNKKITWIYLLTNIISLSLK